MFQFQLNQVLRLKTSGELLAPYYSARVTKRGVNANGEPVYLLTGANSKKVLF